MRGARKRFKKPKSNKPREGADRFSAVVDKDVIDGVRKFCHDNYLPVTTFVTDGLRHWLAGAEKRYNFDE
jgi:hypothetical protein